MFGKNTLLALIFSQLVLYCIALQADTIRVVTEYRNYYQLQNDDGTLGGYATEVVQALFALTGDTAQFEVNPWARSFHEALHNDNVLIYSMAYNPPRAALFDCVAELEQEELFFWALKENISLPVLTLNDLRRYSIAVSKSSNPDQYLTTQGMYKLLHTATPEQSIGMLFKQRADIVISAERSIQRRAAALGYDSRRLKKVFQTTDLNHTLCAAFNYNSDLTLRRRYRAAFETLVQNGTLAEIKQRWVQK
jgi:polar amino acid transport system substrate-binding protein